MNVLVIYGHGGHIGHVIDNIVLNYELIATFPKDLHIRFGFDYPNGSRVDV